MQISTLHDEAGQWSGKYAPGLAHQQVVWLDNLPIALFGLPSTGVSALAYIQPDHLGTPRAIIDPVRDLAIWRRELDGEAFGADAANDDPDGDGVPFAFPLRFPGQQYTPETGLHYNYQRDYDAQVGRYVQSDPIGLRGGISTYGYVEGKPFTMIDPFGLEGVGWWVFPPGEERESWKAASKGSPTVNVQIGVGGSVGYFMAGFSGEVGIAVDSKSTRCAYRKVCGATPAAGGVSVGHLLEPAHPVVLGSLVRALPILCRLTLELPPVEAREARWRAVLPGPLSVQV